MNSVAYCSSVPLEKLILICTIYMLTPNGSEIDMEIADKELYSKDINEGDWVYFGLNNRIFKEQ